MLQSVKKVEMISPCNENCQFCFLNYADILSTNNLFSGLNPEVIGEVIRSVHHQVKEFGKNDIVAYAGDSYNSLYIIVKGSVIGEIIDFEGKSIRIEELKAPNTIATAFIFGHNNQLPVNVTAMEDTRVLSIPREELLRLFKEHDQIMHNYLNIMADRAQHLSRKIRMLGLQSIKAKLANYFLEEQKKQHSENLSIRHTQEELAAMFGITRPALARVIRELDKEGSIQAQRKNVKILNGNRLSSYLKA